MAETNKPEVNLEVSTGFFRITTEQANYNITVLAGYPGTFSPTRQVAPISVQEIGIEPSSREVDANLECRSEALEEGEEYYKKVSQSLFSDIGKLAKQLSHTIMEIPAEDRLAKRVELDEAGERIEEAKNQLKDIVAMTEHATMEIMDRVDRVQAGTNDLKNLLSFLRDHSAFKVEEQLDEESQNSDADAQTGRSVEDLRARLVAASELAATLNAGGEVGAQPPMTVAGPTRYLFQIDPVLQTMYELCTNETVKTHITAARKNAENIFSRDTFIDQISPKVGTLPVEDGFITVPMPDVLRSLNEACSDKAIKNLLKNMESKMDLIFLDQSLPLEAPPVEEGTQTVAVEAPAASTQASVDLVAMLDEALGMVDELAARGGASGEAKALRMSGMSLEDQNEIFSKIESAFSAVSNISSDVFKITESLSFQDLSGQQILKIIKLLSDFQIQLLAMVVSFGSQLKNKEIHCNITAEESKKLAQNDVDAYLNKIVGGTTESGSTLLDQDAVNNMLQEFGF